ncbi:MAG: hypothetical protein ACF8QF_09155 [Phycisphaerales bacterium]
MAHRDDRQHDARVANLERRLRDEAPDALTPGPASMRSRVLGEVWETTPAPAPTLARIGRPLLAAAAVLTVTAGALFAIATRSGQPMHETGARGSTPVFLTLLDEARTIGDRLPALPEQVGVGAETERMLADARRVAERFTRRLTPVRDVFLGAREPAAEPEGAAPAPAPPQG